MQTGLQWQRRVLLKVRIRASNGTTSDRFGTFSVFCSRQGVTTMPDSKKIALITGANKGIGFEIARQLGAKDIVILVGARDRTRGDDAVMSLQSEDIQASAVHLDVTDQATINSAVSFIEE